jgi:hypothetical protein
MIVGANWTREGGQARIPVHPHLRCVSEGIMIEEMVQIAEKQVTRIHQLRGYL